MATPQKFTPVQDMPPKGGYPHVSARKDDALPLLGKCAEGKALTNGRACRWT